MRQNYVRRLLKQPHPQMNPSDQQESALPAVDRYWTEVGQRLAGGGKTRLMAQELERRHLKSVLFGPRYMTRGSHGPAPVNRVLMEMSYADLERRALDLWAVDRGVGSPFFTKELNDNAWGGGL